MLSEKREKEKKTALEHSKKTNEEVVESLLSCKEEYKTLRK